MCDEQNRDNFIRNIIKPTCKFTKSINISEKATRTSNFFKSINNYVNKIILEKGGIFMKNVCIGIAVIGIILVLVGIFVFKESDKMGILTRAGGVAALIGLAGSIYLSRKG